MALTDGTWKPTESSAVGSQPIAERSTTAQHTLGTRVRARDVGSTDYGVAEFIYAKGVASCAAKDWVVVPSDNFTLVRAVANSNGPVGIAMAALTASYYGWVQIYGKAIANCLTQFADNGVVYLTATAGSVDDASVAGDWIAGALGAAAATVGDLHTEFELSYPFAGQRVSVAG